MTPLPLGYVPLLDAAPLIVAHEMGFAAEEGLDLRLTAAPSWSALRDMLAFGQVDAAHMLSPVPVAVALGLGGGSVPLATLMVLSLNGTSVGIGPALAHVLWGAGHGFGFDDAAAAGRALVGLGRPLTIGVPFPFSMHAELLYLWLSASGLPAPQGLDVRTVPPPRMTEAVASGEIDAFCVGEPWGSMAVERGAATLLLPGRAIWTAAPEKVLAARADWADAERGLAGRLMRAVWRAGRWLSEPGAHVTAAEMLARPAYLDLPAEVIDRALTGRLFVSSRGERRRVPGFVTFHEGAATFPWRSQAAWIADRMAARLGLDRMAARDAARAVHRTDLYRDALRGTGAILPGASERVEGGIVPGTAVPSEEGRLILGENRFFDDRVFDPAAGI